jgi:hypothetical protein
MLSPTETVSWYSFSGENYYRQPVSPTSTRLAKLGSPAATEILSDPFWAAKVTRGLDEALAGAGTPLAQFRASLDS